MITLPSFGWKPRHYQEKAWRYLSEGGKRAVMKFHRRSGKDELCLHHVACAAHERVGTYWYCLPQYSQARKSMFDAINPNTGRRRIDDAFPQELRATTREQEMMIKFHNGSTFQLVGSDNFDSLVGSPPVGIVFSEYALSNPTAWAYMRPILLENGGWSIFNSTPRGKNHFKAMCEHAEDSVVLDARGAQTTAGWFYQSLTNDDTRVFSPVQMRDELKELQALHGEAYGRSLWMQEYYVSFDAAIPGSIFGDCVEIARNAGRITVEVPHEKGVPVHTGWDLGRTDDTVIWWYQVFGGELRMIDYHSSNGKDVEFYARTLEAKRVERGFTYGTHYLPHDARPRTLAAGGKSILQQFQDWNRGHRDVLGKFVIAPRLDKQEQIQALRATFPRMWIDGTRCHEGIECLVHYHREWDAELRVFRPAPVHDWSSHGVDAALTVGVSWKAARTQRQRDGETLPSPEQLISGSVGAQSFGALKKRHFAKARAKRDRVGA